MELILVRHGEVEISKINNNLRKILETESHGKYEGALKKLDNIELSERGNEQAKLLGRWLQKNYEIDVFYSSKLRRAKETSEIVNNYLNLPIIFKDELREATFYIPDFLSGWSSPFQFGKNLEDTNSIVKGFIKEEDFEVDNLGPKKDTFLQTYEIFKSKIEKIIKEIIVKNWDKTILIITHGGVIGTIIRNIIGRHDITIKMDFTAVSKFSWIKEYNRWQIDFLNKTDHL
ncbi:MAG: histidine phosphatase family protein [Candidatus Humimicrobiia bacterium]